MNDGAKHGTTRRLEAGTQLLLAAAINRGPFNSSHVTSELSTLRIPSDDVLQHCIPEAARALGQDWLQDRLSFAKVSTASSRLFEMCKEIRTDWYDRPSGPESCSILLATMEREDHLIGPAVLTERLRRAGHSVRMLLNADETRILERLQSVEHDALMISCGSHGALEVAAKTVNIIKSAGVDLPIMLGGACVEIDGTAEINTGADLVTNNIDAALKALAKYKSKSMVTG